jgi:dTMP kinase
MKEPALCEKKRLRRGVLIVLEGIDGTGKSTQAEILQDRLESAGYDTARFREPSDSRWGREIRKKAAQADSLTPVEELDLFQKDRRENVEQNLKPALYDKKVVILDRYYFSTMAYQGAKGIDTERIRKENESFAVPPDLVFILDIRPADGLSRIEGRGPRALLFEREDYLEKVRRIFLSFQGERFFHIDASEAVEAIALRVETIVFAYLKTL